jgi:hypothetical protein
MNCLFRSPNYCLETSACGNQSQCKKHIKWKYENIKLKKSFVSCACPCDMTNRCTKTGRHCQIRKWWLVSWYHQVQGWPKCSIRSHIYCPPIYVQVSQTGSSLQPLMPRLPCSNKLTHQRLLLVLKRPQSVSSLRLTDQLSQPSGIAQPV